MLFVWHHQLQQIQDKLQQALKQHQLLQKENQYLLHQAEKLNAELSTKNQQIEALQQQVDAKFVHAQNLDTTEKQVLEKRIDSYLREIEKCLTLLNG